MHPGLLGLGPSYRDGDGCKNKPGEYFDARIRPWYVAAATGPKDVVLVLDTSGSMGEPASMVIPKGEKGETLLQMMQKAAKRVLNTLTHNDYVAVVTYSTTAEILQPTVNGRRISGLARANNDTVH